LVDVRGKGVKLAVADHIVAVGRFDLFLRVVSQSKKNDIQGLPFDLFAIRAIERTKCAVMLLQDVFLSSAEVQCFFIGLYV
jgi:hypothetical protein